METIFTTILLGLGLSMDAFAVTIGEGLACKEKNSRSVLWLAFYFGLFQGLMPLIGSLLAGIVSAKIMAVGPYISFLLLALVGANMITEAWKGGNEVSSCPVSGEVFNHSKALILAVATSIDALAVGVSLAFTDTGSLFTCAVIALTTFLVCVLGGLLCTRLPRGSGKLAGNLGGAVLIGIGIKLWVEGVFFQ